MRVELYMTELVVANLDESIRWYQDILGLKLERHDHVNRFALLVAPNGRIALREGLPQPAGVGLVFEVEDLHAVIRELDNLGYLPEKRAESAEESYERAVYCDPSGHRITLFAWKSTKFDN